MTKITKTKTNKGTTRIFKNVRDPVVKHTSASPLATYDVVSSPEGTVALQIPLSSIGLQGPQIITTTSNNPAKISLSEIEGPHLPWLRNTAVNFEEFRVTRAVIYFAGNVASTAPGRICIQAVSDYGDLITPVSLANSAGGKLYSLASAASKDLKFQLEVDSTWKKVSYQTVTGLSSLLNIGVLNINNSINDLIFANVVIAAVGVPPNANLGSLSLEYDIEFRYPINSGSNL